jgi:hypothetical protein
VASAAREFYLNVIQHLLEKRTRPSVNRHTLHVRADRRRGLAFQLRAGPLLINFAVAVRIRFSSAAPRNRKPTACPWTHTYLCFGFRRHVLWLSRPVTEELSQRA